jgi:hybrid cluster-associated redox disulfide protein
MIAADEIVGEIMRRHPHTIRVFLDFRFGCVGCPIAGMHSVADAAREHGVELEALLNTLDAALLASSHGRTLGEISKPGQSDR